LHFPDGRGKRVGRKFYALKRNLIWNGEAELEENLPDVTA
jgi:hypothetical protein